MLTQLFSPIRDQQKMMLPQRRVRKSKRRILTGELGGPRHSAVTRPSVAGAETIDDFFAFRVGQRPVSSPGNNTLSREPAVGVDGVPVKVLSPADGSPLKNRRAGAGLSISTGLKPLLPEACMYCRQLFLGSFDDAGHFCSGTSISSIPPLCRWLYGSGGGGSGRRHPGSQRWAM